MNTAVAPNVAHISSSNDVYDPDEVLPKGSPLLQSHRLSLRPSPSPPPQIPLSQVSLPSSPGRRKSNRPPKVKPSQGDAVLISFMGGWKNQEVAAAAGTEALPSDHSGDSPQDDTDESEEEQELEAERQSGGLSHPTRRDSVPGCRMPPGLNPPQRGEPGAHVDLKAVGDPHGAERMMVDPPPPRPRDPASGAGPPGQGEDSTTLTALKSLAAGALSTLSLHEPERETEKPARTPAALDVVITREKAPVLEPSQMVATPREMPIRDDRSATMSAPSPYSPNGLYSPMHPQVRSPIHPVDPRSPGALPPMMHGMGSPRSDTNGQNFLPSIREQLGDIRSLETPHGPNFVHSPPAIRLGPMSHASPPISPNDMYRRDFPSPGQAMSAPSPYNYQHMNGYPRSTEYNSSTTETPSTDHSASTPATSTSITDRMSIDGLTHPQGGSGAYVCKVPGCGAPSFQTQYLLNSHANVHSSARPHYCPVKGCSRSEGGKGFKRKNEMIRHGLVHDSPGYVCPFCPDREHKYPRPDNLQRHVRVHHVDKDKDDPLLRDVLSQRPDGPNRGRRRRG